MNDVSADQLKAAVESQRGGKATDVQSVPAKEVYESMTVWEGVVTVFDLAGHPKGTRAYAWSYPAVGSYKRRYFAVPHTGRINSPIEAVRAAIVAEQKAAKGDRL